MVLQNQFYSIGPWMSLYILHMGSMTPLPQSISGSGLESSLWLLYKGCCCSCPWLSWSDGVSSRSGVMSMICLCKWYIRPCLWYQNSAKLLNLHWHFFAMGQMPNIGLELYLYHHRLLLLKLDKQISGTIYRPFIAANKANGLEGVGCGTYASLDADFHHKMAICLFV